MLTESNVPNNDSGGSKINPNSDLMVIYLNIQDLKVPPKHQKICTTYIFVGECFNNKTTAQKVIKWEASKQGCFLSRMTSHVVFLPIFLCRPYFLHQERTKTYVNLYIPI